MKELAFYFLHDIKEFQKKFQRILERTPRDRTPGNVEFWIAFFRSMASSIQNTQLGQELGIDHVCFSIDSVPNYNTQILKLAFKINDNGQDKVILRSISIGADKDISEDKAKLISESSSYSEKEIEIFEDRIFGDAARTDSAITINLEKVDSEVLHINIKDATIQIQNNNLEYGKGSSGTSAENIKVVNSLQLGQDKTLDTMLDLISNPASASEENTEAFFSDLIRLYNNNNDQKFDVSGDLEAAVHGFTYGLFTLIYKHKYKLDTYVEQSSGKGFSDIEVIFRKMYVNDQDRIINTNAGSHIIEEFKIGDTKDTSAQAAIDQMINGGYNYNLYGRTDSESLIAVGLNPNRKNNSERIKVDLSLRPQSTKNFLSEIVKWGQSIKKAKVENLLKNIYYSIRSEEPLDLVILGNLLSQDTISNKKVFTIESEELPTNTEVTIFSFKHNSEHIILTITDTNQVSSYSYIKQDTQTQPLARTRLGTRKRVQAQNNAPSPPTTTKQELKNVVTQIMRDEKIDTGKIINLTINSKTEKPSGIKIVHKKFNGDNKLESYLQDVTIQNIQDLTETNFKTSTKYNTYDCNINIDAKDLLLALIHSNPPNSPSNEHINTLATFKEQLYKIKDLITSEAEFKSFMHGLYLTKFKPEASLGRGRIDGIIRCDNGKVIGIELKFDQKDINKVAEIQVKEYIKHFKSFTDEKEIEGIVLNFNNEPRPNDDIITCCPLKEPVDHSTSDEGGNSPEKRNPTGEDINEETLSEVELSKTTGANSDLKRPIEETLSNLEDFQNRGQNVGLKKMKGSDGAGCSWMQRRKRNVENCINEEASDDFLYEPLEKDIAATKEQIKEAKLYAQVAMMLSLHSHMGEANAALDSILTYNRNVGEIINEGAQNHSARELKLLQDHYKAAQDFIARYYNLNAENGLNNRLLQDYSEEADHNNSWLVDNGSHSFLVISDKNRYTLYSPDFNYRYLFQTKEGTTFSEVMGLAKAFFKWRSSSTKHKIYTLSRDDNLLQESAKFLKGHPILANPDQFLSDQVLLSRDYHNAIEGISVQTIRALFSIDDTPVDIARLNSDFFQDYGDKIRFRVEALHKTLPFLTEQESIALAAIVKKYNIPADTSHLDKLSEGKQSILKDYNDQVIDNLKTKGDITAEQLSKISWDIIDKALEEHPDISYEDKTKILASSKLIQESIFKNIWLKGKGIATQALFFLPDIIRSANTGNVDSLVQTTEMLGGDAVFNRVYTTLVEGLVERLESVGSVEAASLLSKVPITSPIFKFVVIQSVVELHQQLATLPYGSKERGIIQHELGEQYATLGLMVAELFGVETGPLWVALVLEQVIYGGEKFRQLYHLHISLGEAISMSLGFEQDKFEDIMEDRRLVSRNFAIMNHTENVLKSQFGWKIVKVPVLGRAEWERVDEDQIPEYVKHEATVKEARNRRVMQITNSGGPCQSKVEIPIGEYIKYIHYKVSRQHEGGRLTTSGCDQTRTSNNDYWKRMNYYVIQEDTTINFGLYYSMSCNEVNIFQSESSEKDFQHRLVQPVEAAKYCEEESSSGRLNQKSGSSGAYQRILKYVRIEGGLAAVYVNNKHPLDNIAQGTIYFCFDPREGNVALDLDNLGEVISTLNTKYRSAPLLNNNIYFVTHITHITHITHKPYPSSIIFPESASNKFSLQTRSNAIISKYYIDGTVPSQVHDKSFITQFIFLSPYNTNSTIYRIYINNPSSGKYDISYVQYSRIMDEQKVDERVITISNSSIILEGDREYLEIVSDNIVIDNNLKLSAKHVKVSGVQGRDPNTRLILSQDVETFNLTAVDNITISEKRTELRVMHQKNGIKLVQYYSRQLYTDRLLYKLQVVNIDYVEIRDAFSVELYDMESVSCCWKINDLNNMLNIKSDQDGKHYSLLLSPDTTSLQTIENDQPVRIEIIHHAHKASLDDGLILKNNGQFLTLPSRNDKIRIWKHSKIKDIYRLIFQSDQAYEVVHGFPISSSSNDIIINNIDYVIKENHLYVGAEAGEINANQLIKYRPLNSKNDRIVPIWIDTPLSDSNVSVIEDKVHINSVTFYNLPKNVRVYFKAPNLFKTTNLSFSIKELQDTFSSGEALADSDQDRKRRAVAVDPEPVTSSAVRGSSFINDGIKWLKNGLIEGLSKLLSSTTTANHLDSIKSRKLVHDAYKPPSSPENTRFKIMLPVEAPISPNRLSVNIRVGDLGLDSPDMGSPLRKPTLHDYTKRSLHYVKNCAGTSSINVKDGRALIRDSLSYITPGVGLSKISYKQTSGVSSQSKHFNAVSSGSNRLASWPISMIKQAGKAVLSILPSNWLSSSEEKAHLPASNLLQSELVVAQQPFVKVAEPSNTLLEADVDSSDHQRTPFNASSTGPTLVEMGDQWVQRMDVHGLLTWGTLLARKWTGYRPKIVKSQSYDLAKDVKLSIRSHELVDAFIDKVLSHAQACGIGKVVSDLLENPKLYKQAIDTARKGLATGALNGITMPLFEQLVQQNISNIALKSTPDQAHQLLASLREDLPQVEEQFLKQEVSLEAPYSEAVLATTSKADISLLKQAMCSIGPIDQLTGTISCIDQTYDRKDILVQNSLDYGSRYTKWAGL